MVRGSRDRSEFDLVLARLLEERRRNLAQGVSSEDNHRRRRHRALLLSTVIIAALVASTITFSWPYLTAVSPSVTVNGPRAVIIDELSLTDPDPTFLTNATTILNGWGYHVDYYPPSQVTVDFLRTLPSLAYRMVIFRAHSGAGAIITSQLYSSSEYIYEQLTGSILEEYLIDGHAYFAIAPGFVTNQMQGNFQGATIIAMGCSTMFGTQDLAKAFIHKGASAFIGWDSAVTTDTDYQTLRLLSLMSQGTSILSSISRLNSAGAADPYSSARLVYLDSAHVASEQLQEFLHYIMVMGLGVLVFVGGPLSIYGIMKLLGRT